MTSVPNQGRFGREVSLDGRWTVTERQDTPLLVLIQGGGYDNRYFDAPGCSVLDRAAAAGFPALALTRPVHPADEESARTQPSFVEAAQIVSDAITDAWERLGAGRPGVVLLGHSMGAAVVLHTAARKHAWPLLGVTVSAIGDVVSPIAMQQFSNVPPGVAVSLPFEATRPVLYGPDWTLNDPTLADLADLTVSTPTADMLEISSRWSEDLPKIALDVAVPVQYALAEFDRLWLVSQERVDEFARYFVRAPFVDASLWRGAGHNIEHHALGDAYVRSVLAFAQRCAMELRRPAPSSE